MLELIQQICWISYDQNERVSYYSVTDYHVKIYCKKASMTAMLFYIGFFFDVNTLLWFVYFYIFVYHFNFYVKYYVKNLVHQNCNYICYFAVTSENTCFIQELSLVLNLRSFFSIGSLPSII
ncbi:hypothetical protein DICVIV_07649 [Dictyocaulus viviparus]|uniref:Uncharacterized protein n=1 Tax=Dictyocaulus viviparus TaxID=29172 RepID=A0A0D8XVC4_DICVI|nr:hypothetical protein DICVIV_07649 [Dictyocaulus viviparus]